MYKQEYKNNWTVYKQEYKNANKLVLNHLKIKLPTNYMCKPKTDVK